VHLTLPLLALIALAMAGSFCITVSPYRRPPLPLHLPGKERHPRLAALGALPRRFPTLPAGPPGVDPPSPQLGPEPPALSPSSRPKTETRREDSYPPWSICWPRKFFPKTFGGDQGATQVCSSLPQRKAGQGDGKAHAIECHDCASKDCAPWGRG